MLDCQLYGLDPAGHHFTNVLFHTIAVVLLFLVMQQMTGSLWGSAFVAALFAIHPLHVESVAWVSERKDVLSAVFFMLTLGLCTLCPRAVGHQLFAPPSFVRPGSDVETNAGECSLRSTAFGLLAARQNHKCRIFKNSEVASPKQHPVAGHTSSSGGKGSFVCALRSLFGRDIIYTIPKHRYHVRVAITMATEQRGCQLRCLYLADVLARSAGGHLPPS